MSIPRVGSQLTVRSVYSLTRSANYFNFNHNFYKYETLFLRIRIPYILLIYGTQPDSGSLLKSVSGSGSRRPWNTDPILINKVLIVI